MASYAVGDLQGCYDELLLLLEKINFDAEVDELWLAGDLVNRGPDSLGCLRLAKRLKAKIVLGNHDLHLLACYYSEHLLKKKDTLTQILDADDCDTLMAWLVQQPLMHYDAQRNIVMSHAGLPHIWNVQTALALSDEVHQTLIGHGVVSRESYFTHMYGNDPSTWDDALLGLDRLRVITNYFTRMRFINMDGALELSAKEGLDKSPNGYQPWFEFQPKHKATMVFGHWAAIEGFTGQAQFQALDTGCVWGGSLTALNLDSLERTCVAAT